MDQVYNLCSLVHEHLGRETGAANVLKRTRIVTDAFFTACDKEISKRRQLGFREALNTVKASVIHAALIAQCAGAMYMPAYNTITDVGICAVNGVLLSIALGVAAYAKRAKECKELRRVKNGQFNRDGRINPMARPSLEVYITANSLL